MTTLGRDRIIILSTHIVADLGAGCTDMALIDKGRVEFGGSPEDLIKRAKGSVFEIIVTPQQYESGMLNGFEIISREESSNGISIRAVSGNRDLPANATPVENPNIEEAYLAFIASKGRTGDSLDSEKEVIA
jgi:ABC-2 type transport system ATP-binding protein